MAYRRATPDPDNPYFSTGPCALCRGDQSTRHAHYLELARGPGGTDGLEKHLYGDLSQRLGDSERVTGYVKDMMTWVKGEMEQWGGQWDQMRGDIPWHVARRREHGRALQGRDKGDPRRAYERETYRREHPPANDEPTSGEVQP